MARRLLSPARVLALAALLVGSPSPGSGQALRLNTLKVLEDSAPGPWVTYQVRTQSRSFPPRELTQRAAIVAAEGIGEDAGVWIELKTIDPQAGTRIDRGFYGRTSGGDPPGAGSSGARALSLRRVQILYPDGKLYEYPPNSNVALRAEEDVTTLGLFEINQNRPPRVDTLGVDTLRIGRKTLPTRIIRREWIGSDEWSETGDSSFVNRVILTLTEHVCPEVPVTGFTRSAFEVATARFAVSDSLLDHPLPPPGGSAVPVVYRAELSLGDMGTGAVPEVTQEPEPAPEAGDPAAHPGIIR